MQEIIPIDYGVPDNGIQFGLYFYPMDRFLFVGNNEEIVDTIRTILRSKITLSKLPVYKFKNWNPSIIDNTVCSCWGVRFNNAAPILVDNLVPNTALQEVEFFANMVFWIEMSLNSLKLSKSYAVGLTNNATLDNELELFDDVVVQNIVESDKQRSVEFDLNINRMRTELHKICYWARSKKELADQLDAFVLSENLYNRLFYKELLNWWKI